MRNSVLILFIVSLLLFPFLLSAAQPEAETPLSADSLRAIHTRLLKLEQEGVRNADFFNQLGLSYYKQGDLGRAVLCFLRALRLESSHKAARNNLAYARSRTADRELYPQPSFMSSLVQDIFNFFSLNSLAVIVLLLLALTVLCLHWLLHLPVGGDRAVPVMWLIIIGFIFLLSVTMLGLKYRSYMNPAEAVILQQEVDGFSGPGPEFGKLFTLHAGLVVHINRVDKDWALITLPNAGAGWIHISALQCVRF
jgi:tetratricopeptide (TPR) repeat protein